MPTPLYGLNESRKFPLGAQRVVVYKKSFYGYLYFLGLSIFQIIFYFEFTHFPDLQQKQWFSPCENQDKWTSKIFLKCEQGIGYQKMFNYRTLAQNRKNRSFKDIKSCQSQNAKINNLETITIAFLKTC